MNLRDESWVSFTYKEVGANTWKEELEKVNEELKQEVFQGRNEALINTLTPGKLLSACEVSHSSPSSATLLLNARTIKSASDGVGQTISNPVILVSSSNAAQVSDADLKMKGKIIRNDHHLHIDPVFEIAPEHHHTTNISIPTSRSMDIPLQSVFDPLRHYDSKYVAEFKKWFYTPKSKQRPMRLGVIDINPVKADWFTALYKPKWLCTEHIDALLNLLIQKSKDAPELFLPRWTCLERIGFEKLALADPSKGIKTLMKFVCGELPGNCGRPWWDVDNVYGIANVNNNHWIAYNINILDQTVYIVDSLFVLKNWAVIKAKFRNVVRSIPWLCKHANVEHFKGPRKDVWDLLLVKNAPQQRNSYDCGIYAIKFIECFVSGHPLTYLSGTFEAKSREYYCAELFHTCT